MCTLTVIPLDDGYRVVHNRDELRSRAPALPPEWRDAPPFGRAVWPVDPDAGGTWIAAREDGVVYAILNVNPSAEPAPPPESRGRVISDLLGLPADAPLRHPRSRHMRSYRIVRVRPTDAGPLVEVHRSFGADSEDDASRLTAPRCWVSSGLGDDRVAPRLPLFEETLARHPTPGGQDAFHRHVWEGRPEISVLMSREDARTVGITTVEVRFGPDGPRIGLDYEPVPPSA